MSDAIDTILDGILAREGGFVDDAHDRGGATNRGITIPALSEYRGYPVTVSDIKNLTEQEAREVYRRMYVEKPGFLQVQNDTLQELLVDIEVNHRPGKAVRFLQKALGVTQDGKFGPITKAALDATVDVAAVYRKVCADRVRLYGRIVTDDPSQAVFAAGWGNRAASFVERAP